MIVQSVHMDMEFDKTVDDFSDRTVVNTSAAREHVTEIKRQIRTTKDRCHAIVSTLPFESVPKLTATNIVYFVVLWLNAFPVRNIIFKKHSPRLIVICNKLNWKQHFKMPFFTYCEVPDELDPSNDMTPRTHKGIAIGPTGNIQGTYKFFCMNNDLIPRIQNFTKFNMPDSMIKKVNAYGSKARKRSKKSTVAI